MLSGFAQPNGSPLCSMHPNLACRLASSPSCWIFTSCRSFRCREMQLQLCAVPVQRPLLQGLLRHCLAGRWLAAAEELEQGESGISMVWKDQNWSRH